MADPVALQVESVPTERLFPNPANPRINEPAVPHVAASIRRFGFQQPVVAKRSGELVAGHTRWKAAKSLGLVEIPVVWFEGTDLDATAYAIADNRTHEFATWDDAALAAILEALRKEDALEGVGYTGDEIDALILQLDEVCNPGEIVEDVPPEPPDKATTQRGDLWILGKHRLYCGDSSNAEDLDRLVAGEPIHLVNMDPPYNVKVEPRSNNAIAAGLSSFTPEKQTHHQALDLARNPGKAKGTTRKMRAKDRPLANDFLPADEFERILLAWFQNASRVLEPGRSFYIWGGYANLANYPGALRASGLYFAQAIIWNKLHPVLTRKDFMGAHEWCLYGWKEGAGHEFFGPNNATDLWEVKKVPHTSMVHLTEKPVELARRAIEFSSRPGENVLDLFGGSGSTLIGAEMTGRRAYLMELDPLYCDVIVQRWEKFTGRKAERVGSNAVAEEKAATRVAAGSKA